MRHRRSELQVNPAGGAAPSNSRQRPYLFAMVTTRPVEEAERTDVWLAHLAWALTV
jgi:hypothetical protein